MLTKDQCKVQDMVAPYATRYTKSRYFSLYFNNLFPNRSGIRRTGSVKFLQDYFCLIRPMSLRMTAYLPFHSSRNFPNAAPSIHASVSMLSLQYFL